MVVKMRKILLTSTGLQYKAVAEKFLSMISSKSVDEIKILFLPTASRTEVEMSFVRKSINELLDLGVKNDNIIWFDLEKSSNNIDENQFDCIYVCGGNSYYLLHKLKTSGYYSRICEWVDNGLFYIGVSAGSVVTTPDINYISFMDVNDIGLADTTALSLIPERIIPHYTNEFSDIVCSLNGLGVKTITLSDSEALYVYKDKAEVIG